MRLKINYSELIEQLRSIPEKPIVTSFLVLFLLGCLVLGLSLPFYVHDFPNFYPQVLAEAHGMLFDITVIGILLYWLNQKGDEQLRVRTYKDEIDDFRMWQSEEAAFRTVGNIKRLNRHKITNINLVECHLARTNLNYVNLSGSNLNSANLSNAMLVEVNLEDVRLNQTNLENSNLNNAILKKAYASGANFKDSSLIKVNFEGAFLIKSNFKNAFLMEANLQSAYVTGADFENANLYKADLRQAIGLTLEQLRSAKTIYKALIDPELQKQLDEHHPEMMDNGTH